MKKILCLLGLAATAAQTYGQNAVTYAADAFRFSESVQTGTARFRGLGGNHAALGADATNAFGNPAGLAFYNRSEISVSPGLTLNSNSTTYIDQTQTGSRTTPNVAHFGLVLAGDPRNTNSRWRRTAWGLTFSRQVDFNNQFSFSGRNNRSSFVDRYIEIANTGALGSQLDDQYDRDANQAQTIESAAYRLFLINGQRFVNPQGFQDERPPYFRFNDDLPRDQTGTFLSSRGLSQWNLAYAGNLDDKLYIGGSLGLTRLRFESETVLRETVVGNGAFDNYTQRENLTVTGGGINLALGLMYKIDPNLQVGANVVTPTFGNVRETFTQNLSVVPRDQALATEIQRNSELSIDVVPNDFRYRLSSPLRASGGVTYFLGQGKIGFITATAEYVGYGGMRVSTTQLDAADNTAFRNDVRDVVRDTYRNVVNVRAGAEIRAGLLRVRGGVAYLPNPYRLALDGLTDADRQKLVFSGGLGLRNERFFADVAGSLLTFTSAFTPYELQNPADFASARIRNRNTNLTLSVGAFF